MNKQKYFGKWEIEEELGSGAFGTVYKISHEEFGRKYYSAMKVIHVPQDKTEKNRLISEGMDQDSISSYYDQCVQDFVKEIEFMSSLQGYTNIVCYYDHLTEKSPDGIGYTIYIRMEYLTPLDKYLVDDESKFRLLSVKEIMKLGVDICNALEVCNKKHIIHRDIKPDNIFISETGDYKLGDFGISRQLEHTQSNLSKKGTYTYMAPEIYNGQPYNSTVDIYSLGIVLYRLLNHNRTPFLPAYPDPIKYTDKEKALINRMQGVAIPSIPDVDPQINSIVLKCCAFDPKDRYPSASELKSDLLKVYKRLPDSESSEKSEKRIIQENNQRNAGNDTGKKKNSHLVDSDNEIEHSNSDNSLDKTVSFFDTDPPNKPDTEDNRKKKKSSKLDEIKLSYLILLLVIIAAAFPIGFLTGKIRTNKTQPTATQPIITQTYAAEPTVSSYISSPSVDSSSTYNTQPAANILSGVPSTPAEVVARYNEVINAAKKMQNGTVHKVGTVEIQCTDCSVSFLQSTVDKLLQTFMTDTDKTFTVKGGKATDQDGNTADINAYIVPKDRDAALKEEYVASATATASGDGYTLSITLKKETSTFDGTDTVQPAGHQSCLDPLNLATLEIPAGATITEAAMTYSGATLTATVNGAGQLTKLDVKLPLEGTGTGKLGASLTLGLKGKSTECYEFTYEN